MKIALLRVGIDTGSGGIHGPLFEDNSFEYIPIPDDRNKDERTYGKSWADLGDRWLITFLSLAAPECTVNQFMWIQNSQPSPTEIRLAPKPA